MHPMQHYRETNRISQKNNLPKKEKQEKISGSTCVPQQQKQSGSFFFWKIELASAFSMISLAHSHQFDYKESNDIQSFPEYPQEIVLELEK